MILQGYWHCLICDRWATTVTRPPRHTRLTRTGKPRKCPGEYAPRLGWIEVRR